MLKKANISVFLCRLVRSFYRNILLNNLKEKKKRNVSLTLKDWSLKQIQKSTAFLFLQWKLQEHILKINTNVGMRT